MRPVFLTLFCLSLLLSPLSVFAQGELTASKSALSVDSNPLLAQVEFLPVEQAYILNSEFESSGKLRLNWQIADGYYLYRHGFEFTLNNGDQKLVVTPSIPDGIKKQDDYFGLVEVYYNNIDILLDNIPEQSGLTLTVTSQGCADAGLCYPPYSEHFQLDGQQATVFPVDRSSSATLSPPASPAGQSESSLAYMLILAIIGGAILNLMPCVFPVLSLKVLGFANDKNHSQVTHGFAYSAGVVISFVAVAAVLVSLQAAGEAIGWGFQLQSPWFVAALAYLFFVMGLSLSGYIELGSQWMNTGGKLAAKPGYAGSFFTGILATVVASPCTAPFMGSALGYAATQSTAIALLVFAALGVGMALPVLILSCSPKLLNKLPKPGPWMEQLKQFLAFPLYATAVWLSWVVGKQTGVNGMAGLLLGCILIALAVWLWRGKIVQRTLASACAAMAIAIIAGPLLTPASNIDHSQQNYQAYSPGLLQSLREQGKPVFINITADWCITCLANEKTTLGTNKVKSAMSHNEVTYLKADWTNRDPQITALLKQYGRSGIPLYIIYGQGNSLQGELLPQILTVDTMLNALSDAGKPAQLTTR
jgi:thiol:disulfide interchange protein DsbD